MLLIYLRVSALLVGGALFLLLGFLLFGAWPLLRQEGLAPLFASQWYPFEGLFGMAPALLGSLWALLLALFIALPLALAGALFNIELVPPRGQGFMRLGMQVLAGIPSVVYGLMGLWLLLPLLETQLNLLTGRTLLAAGLLLALMILPTLMVMSEEALRGVRAEQRESAINLGLDWNQCLWRIVLPQAWPGIRSACLLALGRALGETVAVMLVVGSMDRLPQPWYNLLQPAQTLTSRIGREIGEASLGSLHWSALMASGLLLATLALLLASLAQLAGRKNT